MGARSALSNELWGENGEEFVPTGRLMDWSFAGYGSGDRPIPTVEVVARVDAFGATPDDDSDDAAAFVTAIEAAAEAGGGAVELSAGRYVLRSRLELPSGVVLRGAGRDATVLDIPEPLESLYPGERNWSFGGGFLFTQGGSTFPELTQVAADAMRGDRTVEVVDASELRVGDRILIRQDDVDGTLMRRLHADHVAGGEDNVGDVGMRFPSRIEAITGTSVTLERALPLDIEGRWLPTVRAFENAANAVREVGVESLTIAFPLTDYLGHFNELGYNAIHFDDAVDSWVRDVTIQNADYGVSFTYAYFCTATGVTLETTGDRGELAGHHGLNNGHGGDNFFVDFVIDAEFVHDLTNEWYAHGVVFARGSGANLALDHHRAAPYSTLWTELDLGLGTRPFRSGGRGDRGPHTAAYNTLWNVRADRPLEFPDADFGPTMTFVGFETDESAPDEAIDWYVDEVSPAELEPTNLWQAMLRARRGDEPSEDAGTSDSGTDAGETDASSDAGAGDTGAGDTGGSDSATDAATDTLVEAPPSSDGGCSAGGHAPGNPVILLSVLSGLFIRRRR